MIYRLIFLSKKQQKYYVRELKYNNMIIRKLVDYMN